MAVFAAFEDTTLPTNTLPRIFVCPCHGHFSLPQSSFGCFASIPIVFFFFAMSIPFLERKGLDYHSKRTGVPVSLIFEYYLVFLFTISISSSLSGPRGAIAGNSRQSRRASRRAPR